MTDGAISFCQVFGEIRCLHGATDQAQHELDLLLKTWIVRHRQTKAFEETGQSDNGKPFVLDSSYLRKDVGNLNGIIL